MFIFRWKDYLTFRFLGAGLIAHRTFPTMIVPALVVNKRLQEPRQTLSFVLRQIRLAMDAVGRMTEDPCIDHRARTRLLDADLIAPRIEKMSVDLESTLRHPVDEGRILGRWRARELLDRRDDLACVVHREMRRGFLILWIGARHSDDKPSPIRLKADV